MKQVQKEITDIKQKGRQFFKLQNYEQALTHFQRACLIAQAHFNQDSDIKKLFIICLNNIATTYFKLKKYYFALKYCNRVLEFQPNNEKGLSRRALTYKSLGQQIQKNQVQHDLSELQNIYKSSKIDLQRLMKLGMKGNQQTLKNINNNLTRVQSFKEHRKLQFMQVTHSPFQLSRICQIMERRPNYLMKYLIKLNPDMLVKTQLSEQLIKKIVLGLFGSKFYNQDQKSAVQSICIGLSKNIRFNQFKSKFISAGQKKNLREIMKKFFQDDRLYQLFQ